MRCHGEKSLSNSTPRPVSSLWAASGPVFCTQWGLAFGWVPRPAQSSCRHFIKRVVPRAQTAENARCSLTPSTPHFTKSLSPLVPYLSSRPQPCHRTHAVTPFLAYYPLSSASCSLCSRSFFPFPFLLRRSITSPASTKSPSSTKGPIPRATTGMRNAYRGSRGC